MNVMVALPGNNFFSLPLSVLEKYAVSEEKFNAELAEKESIFGDDVTGQSASSGRGSAAFGIRG